MIAWFKREFLTKPTNLVKWFIRPTLAVMLLGILAGGSFATYSWATGSDDWQKAANKGELRQRWQSVKADNDVLIKTNNDDQADFQVKLAVKLDPKEGQIVGAQQLANERTQCPQSYTGNLTPPNIIAIPEIVIPYIGGEDGDTPSDDEQTALRNAEAQYTANWNNQLANRAARRIFENDLDKAVSYYLKEALSRPNHCAPAEPTDEATSSWSGGDDRWVPITIGTAKDDQNGKQADKVLESTDRAPKDISSDKTGGTAAVKPGAGDFGGIH